MNKHSAVNKKRMLKLQNNKNRKKLNVRELSTVLKPKKQK